jgi:hypothetical protein
MRLYRPVGQAELDLITASGYARFPPRMPEQPIFYPVLDRAYAEQIARDWNTRDAASGFVGYVTAFNIDDTYAARFSIQTVGSSIHRELWIPADQLDEFNRHIIGKIEVIATYKP